MSNIFKKILSGFVSLTTIAWSVGFGTFVALPSVASAATPGELIKASTPAVYYFAADGKRYVFPNEKTYFSWFNDFSSVRTISDAELASYLIGGNVTIRPGTKLVKITTDSKVYAPSHDGVLHWIESESVATALYGASWASRVVDVPDVFFINYSIGSSLSSPVHPDGTVVSMGGSRYVVTGGMKRMIASDSVFASNGYNTSNVISTSVSYPNGADVTGREGRLADPIYVGSVAVGGNLTVALASDTPAGVTVPKGASSVMLAKYNFTAGSAAATVAGLSIRRVGVGATSDFSNVYLYKADGTRLTTGRTINSSSNMVSFNSLNLVIPAGQTMSLMLVGDINPSVTTTGGQHAFEISDAASTVLSAAGTVSGSFPVRGNTFTIGTTSASRLDVQKGSTPSNPQIGSAEAEISNFKLVAGNNDIEVRRITLIQAGSVSNTDLSNLKLYQGTTVVATTPVLAGDKIVLNFNPPYVITDGSTRTFSLKATVGGRSARTIKTYVEYSTDVYAIDTEFNTGAQVCVDSTSPCAGTFDGNSTNFIEVTTEGGQFTTTFNGPAASNLAKGQQDVALYKFALTSSDSAIEVRKMYFNIQGATAADEVKGGSGTEYFRDIKVKNLDNGQVLMGPISMPSTVANNATETGVMSFTDSFTINAGQTLNLAITADLSNTEDNANEFFGDNNNQYRVVMGNGTNLYGSSDLRIVETGEFLPSGDVVPNSPITGNFHTVKAASLTVALAANPTAGTAVKKEQNIPAAGFVFSAGSESEILVRTVKLTGRADVTTTGTYALADLNDAITTCSLWNGTTQVGTAQNPDATTGAMTIDNVNVTVPAGGSLTLVAKCTADSTLTSSEDKFAIGIAAAADVTADDSDDNSVTASLSSNVTGNAGATPSLVQTIKNGGILTIATDNLRQSTILVAGGDVWQNFAQFKATAQFEAMNLERLNVTSTGESANFVQVAVAMDGSPKGMETLSSGFSGNKDVDITSSPIMVPKDGSVTFQLWGKLGAIQASSTVSGATTGAARSGARLRLGLGANLQTGNWDANYAGMFNVRAVGQASGDIVYSTGVATTGNEFVVRKSKPTVTRQTLSTTTLANGTNMDLYRMQISADAAGSIAVKKVVFDISSTNATTLSNFRIRKGSTELPLSSVVITKGDGVDLEAGTATSGRVVVVFSDPATANTEETITGSGNVYTLTATVAGTVGGDTVSVAPARDLAGTIVTGYLDQDAFALNGTSVVGPNLDANGAGIADGAADQPGSFVWSDLSEVPHSAGEGASGGSYDWTNDVYVEDLTQVQTLTR